MTAFDIAIVGGGIAGASVAAELAPYARVVLIEAEDQPGYHATGRSAAFWSETYGGPGVQPLTTASGPWLRDPPADVADAGFLSARRELFIGRQADAPLIDAMVATFADAGLIFQSVDPAAFVPGLRPDWRLGLLDPSCCDIDVGGLHGAYLRTARRHGVHILTSARLIAAARAGAMWHLETTEGTVAAGILVNAAGAWADEVAALAGVPPVGIAPLRRTLAQLRVEPGAPSDMPLIRDVRDQFYFKPEAGGRIWLSPHDEIPDRPRDVAPEEIDVAVAIDRLEAAVDWRIAAVERRWAGLRSFAPDRLPVYGFDDARPGFFWFAGQGGFGIQTAPAAAKLAKALILNATPEPLVRDVDASAYLPARLAAASA